MKRAYTALNRDVGCAHGTAQSGHEGAVVLSLSRAGHHKINGCAPELLRSDDVNPKHDLTMMQILSVLFLCADSKRLVQRPRASR